jgi:hypothetical protein
MARDAPKGRGPENSPCPYWREHFGLLDEPACTLLKTTAAAALGRRDRACQGRRCPAAGQGLNGPDADAASGARRKAGSRDMAARLVREKRLTLETARWALRQSGHDPGEIRRWEREASR